MGERSQFIEFNDFRGGRNGTDPPLSLPPNQVIEALNVDWSEGTLAHKRLGASAVSDTGGTAFSSGIQSLFRHVPGADETAAEFWGIDGAATPIVKRMTGGTSFANVTLDDAIATKPQDVVGVSFNGKLFLFYDSSTDRPHVYDPSLSSPRVRRMGFADPTTAPTVANQGSGTYAAVKRYYRIRWIQYDSGIIRRRSEPSDSVEFTPNGTSQYARVTRPTAPNEGETHWELEVSLDNAVWYVRAGAAHSNEQAVATTFVDDDMATTEYTSRTLSDPIGTYTPPTSAKYAITDGNRLLIAGAWESGGLTSTVWFTPVLGSADKGDDERIPNTTTQKNRVALNERDGGAITGMGGPIGGIPYVFKYRQVYRLIPTGDVAAPYLVRKWIDGIGCIAHKSIVVGEDEAGRPALYWMSHRGPYRAVVHGTTHELQYLGRDNEDIWSTMNLGATTVASHAIWHADKHQVWFWIATSANNDPDTKMMFDVHLGQPDGRGQVRGGWAKHTGNSAGARCSVMMSNTLGATMSRDLKPYIGRSSGTAMWKTDTGTDDAGTNFQAYVEKVQRVAPVGHHLELEEGFLVAEPQSGVTITQTLIRDFGLESRTSTAILTASASETRVVKKFEGAALAEAAVIHGRWGDGSAASNTWTLENVTIPVKGMGRR